MASASETVSALPPNRRGAVAQWFVLLGAAIAIAVIVALVATWPHHTSTASHPSPAAAKQADRSQSAAAAALKP
jgi:hypothetical protein